MQKFEFERDVLARRLPRHPQTFTPLRLYRLHKLKQCELLRGAGKACGAFVRLRAAPLPTLLDIIFAGIPEGISARPSADGAAD
ncbi:hypothetical protein EVAR_99320_1 [Eumeta japonica]|uniref:Uncharacterized protein n=1 Tax=Eumeta variegata TaxID=151549 RepID=A0A4C1TCB8_EUMVA|nr:hypothetical protein EVAR_99320_1 [Eumeta japonica]